MRSGFRGGSPAYARPGSRARAERVLLPARGASAGGERPPVRIFVGTESGQHRAERVFVWSIEQVRDPARAVEIFLMRDLKGFDRRRWLTGFTNYRFAIPELTGGAGRAIYNDVDQIYLRDPAQLFDLDMNGRGFLSIRQTDTSVMLIDCARMAQVWTPELVRSERRKRIEERSADQWGPLAPEWNARDEEHVPGRTGVLHFTTIHTQPWQPFPERFVYQHNPVGEVWLELERSANQAGYQIFGAEQPSDGWRELLARLAKAPVAASPAPPEVGEALSEARARTVLEISLGSAANAARPVRTRSFDGRTTTAWDPAIAPLAKTPAETFDAVVCHDALDRVPDEDAGWFVAELFRHAQRLVVATAGSDPAKLTLAGGEPLAPPRRGEAFWLAHFETAAAAHPDVRWRLALRTPRANGAGELWLRDGGPRADGPPRVWVLTDDKAGHTTQSVGFAEALGWPFERKALRFTPLNRLSNHLLDGTKLGLHPSCAAQLAPPWPDLVISTGRRTAPVARWIGKQSRGRSRLVQLGRKGGDVAGRFDLAVTCWHFRLPPHPRRIETLIPFSAVNSAALADAAERRREVWRDAQRPRIALLVGGSSANHRLDAEAARRIGRDVAALARGAGGSVLATTSPRTGEAATDALAEGLGADAFLYRWRRGGAENPYQALLGAADAIVVTGDSESMLAEAVATKKPVYVAQVPELPPGPRRRFAEWVMRRASARPRKQAKGTVRPQQGIEYLCARLVERAIVRPPRDVSALHRELARRGLARPLGATLDLTPPPPLTEWEEVAARVRALLGVERPAARVEALPEPDPGPAPGTAASVAAHP